jgi:ubiquinone/menaquinone biosynthesis C-methylase UbiE
MNDSHGGIARSDLKAMARFFDEALRVAQFQDFDSDEFAAAQRLLDLSGVQPGQRIFEPGCGTGRFTAMLRQRIGAAGEIAACEISEAMLEACRARNLPPNVKFHQGADLDIGLSARSCDLIICLNLWPHLADIERRLGRYAEILKPEGALIIAHTNSREKVNAIHGFVAGEEVCAHPLPPARDLAEGLGRFGWKIKSAFDDEDVYFAASNPPD